MIGRKVLLALSILFCPSILFAQGPAVDYSRADSLALTVKYEHDINLLTKKLTTSFSDSFLKARAIFRWITDNIAYDYKYYNTHEFKGRDPETFECSGDSMDCDVRLKVWESNYVRKVLDRRKAVCQGYAMLFKKMCGIAGIEAEVVPGYVRTEWYEVGTPGNLDHAWNLVLLNGAYYPVDATWAAGGCSKDDEGKLLAFHKRFNDYYWLTPAEDFARDHFPEDPKWILLPRYTKDNFSANPYYNPEVITRIKLLAPKSGIITAKKGDTLRFRIKYTGPMRELQINTNIFTNPDVYTWATVHKKIVTFVMDTVAFKKQQYVKYKRENYVYEFVYVVQNYSLEYIDIIFDTRRVMRFKVKVH